MRASIHAAADQRSYPTLRNAVPGIYLLGAPACPVRPTTPRRRLSEGQSLLPPSSLSDEDAPDRSSIISRAALNSSQFAGYAQKNHKKNIGSPPRYFLPFDFFDLDRDSVFAVRVGVRLFLV